MDLPAGRLSGALLRLGEPVSLSQYILLNSSDPALSTGKTAECITIEDNVHPLLHQKMDPLCSVGHLCNVVRYTVCFQMPISTCICYKCKKTCFSLAGLGYISLLETQAHVSKSEYPWPYSETNPMICTFGCLTRPVVLGQGFFRHQRVCLRL